MLLSRGHQNSLKPQDSESSSASNGQPENISCNDEFKTALEKLVEDLIIDSGSDDDTRMTALGSFDKFVNRETQNSAACQAEVAASRELLEVNLLSLEMNSK